MGKLTINIEGQTDAVLMQHRDDLHFHRFAPVTARDTSNGRQYVGHLIADSANNHHDFPVPTSINRRSADRLAGFDMHVDPHPSACSFNGTRASETESGEERPERLTNRDACQKVSVTFHEDAHGAPYIYHYHPDLHPEAQVKTHKDRLFSGPGYDIARSFIKKTPFEGLIRNAADRFSAPLADRLDRAVDGAHASRAARQPNQRYIAVGDRRDERQDDRSIRSNQRSPIRDRHSDDYFRPARQDSSPRLVEVDSDGESVTAPTRQTASDAPRQERNPQVRFVQEQRPSSSRPTRRDDGRAYEPASSSARRDHRRDGRDISPDSADPHSYGSADPYGDYDRVRQSFRGHTRGNQRDATSRS